MKKPGKVVIENTLYISSFVIALSVVMQLVFILLSKWNYTVLLGNILSGFFAVFNFLLMGMTVESAVVKEEKEARNIIKTSQTLRSLMLLVVAAIGALLPCFNIWASVIPFLFPRIAIALRPFIDKFGNKSDNTESSKGGEQE